MAKGKKTGGRIKGVPNKATIEIKAVAQQWGPAAIKALAGLAGLDPKGTQAESEQARIAAMNIILDRAYGKAAQPLTGEGGEGAVAMTVTVDRPPDETREQWIERRAREIGAGAAVGATARPPNGRDHS